MKYRSKISPEVTWEHFEKNILFTKAQDIWQEVTARGSKTVFILSQSARVRSYKQEESDKYLNSNTFTPLLKLFKRSQKAAFLSSTFSFVVYRSGRPLSRMTYCHGEVAGSSENSRSFPLGFLLVSSKVPFCLLLLLLTAALYRKSQSLIVFKHVLFKVGTIFL